MFLHTHTNTNFDNFSFLVLWASSFLSQTDVLTWAKNSYFLPRQDFLTPCLHFCMIYCKTDKVNFSVVLLCKKKQKPSFIIGVSAVL